MQPETDITTRGHSSKVIFSLEKIFVRLSALVSPLFLVGLFAMLKRNQTVMTGWVSNVMAPVEQFLGRICSVFPFSVAEILMILFFAGCVVQLIRTVFAIWRKDWKQLIHRMLSLGAVWLWLWAGLCWMWNASYYAPTFAQREGIVAGPCSTAELISITEFFARQAAMLSSQVARDKENHFVESLPECFDRGIAVYQTAAQSFPSLDVPSVRAKPLLCSRLQSILGFTGVYSPFTGEANVNVDAPACLIPFTIAHEMSHQRMVSSEQEANFVGIVSCISSGDIVFQYSGYLTGLIHLCNALNSISSDAWLDIEQRYFTPELTTDWNDNNLFWEALRSPVEHVAGDTYDSFLKGNNQELGIRSYGACVDLLLRYRAVWLECPDSLNE